MAWPLASNLLKNQSLPRGDDVDGPAVSVRAETHPHEELQ